MEFLIWLAFILVGYLLGGVMFCLYYIIQTLREEKTKRAGSESMADAEEISDGDIDDICRILKGLREKEIRKKSAADNESGRAAPEKKIPEKDRKG